MEARTWAATPVAAGRAAGVGEAGRAAWRLLAPRFLAARNRLRRLDRRGRVLVAGLALLGLGFWAGIFVLFRRALGYFLAVPDFGPILTYKLLGMVFLTFFSILLFSNIVTALSTFFLSRDLERLVPAPVPWPAFFAGRFGDTLLESSWMIVVFALPAFLAYGLAHDAGPAFYVLAALVLPPFLVIPAALGVMVTAVLVAVFPARRTRDVLVLLSVVGVAVVYLLLRMLEPERLVNPEAFATFVQFLAAMQAPASPLLPSTWVAEILHPARSGRLGGVAFHLALLASTAAALLVLCEATVRRLYLAGLSRAQEGRRGAVARRALWERAVAVLGAPLAPQTRLLLIRELKTFFRDTSQWSQLILLLALVVVYIYNFSVLPLPGGAVVTLYFSNVIAFVNLALAAFVIASVALRFVVPSVSLEGRAVWIPLSAPVPVARVWWSKFWAAVVPLLVLGETLVLVSNSALGVHPLMAWLSPLTLAGLTVAMVALGLAVGATWPKFDADSAARVAAGAGGLVYMIACMSFIAAVVVLEAWPVYALLVAQFRDRPLAAWEWVTVGAALALAAVIVAAVFAGSVRHGIRQLARLET